MIDSSYRVRNAYDLDDMITAAGMPTIGFLQRDPIRRGLTCGELRKHLAKFDANQRIFLQGEDGELREIYYAELVEYK